jgi:hypothetical protein
LLSALYVRAILSGGFHTEVKTVIGMEPVRKFVKVAIVGGKAFLLVVRLDAIVSGNDGSN